MTAATQDVTATVKLGTEDTPPPALLALPVESNTLIYGGTMVASDSSGNAVPAKQASALMVWGRCERQINNLTGQTPFQPFVTIRPGPFYWYNDGSITAAMVGQPAYALDDETVTSNPCVAGATYWLPFAGLIMPPAVGKAGIIIPTNTMVPVYSGFPSPSSIVLHGNIAVPLATIQAGTSGTAFNIGNVLPANTKLIGASINVVTPLSGGANTTATASLATSADATFPTNAKATIIAATTVFTGAFTPISVIGSNPYDSRGGQQLQMTITTSGTQSALTAGVLSVDVYYTIVQ